MCAEKVRVIPAGGTVFVLTRLQEEAAGRWTGDEKKSLFEGRIEV
jgi:hypothetical protein